MPTFPERLLPPLSKRQADCLEVLRKYIKRHGYPPTRGEIGKAMGIKNDTSVRSHLAGLEKKGRIVVQIGSSRAITIIHRRAELGL